MNNRTSALMLTYPKLERKYYDDYSSDNRNCKSIHIFFCVMTDFSLTCRKLNNGSPTFN